MRDGENRRCLPLGLIQKPTSLGKGDALRLFVVLMAILMPLVGLHNLLGTGTLRCGTLSFFAKVCRKNAKMFSFHLLKIPLILKNYFMDLQISQTITRLLAFYWNTLC